MNPRILVVLVLAAALALLLALRLRNPVNAESSPENSAPRSKETSAASPSVIEEPGVKAPASPAAVKLHGLRLLAREEAEARGWAAPVLVKTPAEIIGEATWQKWAATPISINLTDAPLADLVADLMQRYGLLAKIDEEYVDVESHTVTFRVEELAADQAVDLILKMADLAWFVDTQGTLWITTKDRAREIAAERAPVLSKAVQFTASCIRGSGRSTKDQPSLAERRAAWMKGRTVTVSIANKPLLEAVEELARAGGLEIYSWSEAAQKAVALAPIASVIGENLPLDATLESLLAPAGLGLDLWGGDRGQIETRAELEAFEEWEKFAKECAKEEAKERAAFSARKVRIEGKVLTLKAVAAQLEAQLGERVIVMPALENIHAVWEADGLEQTAGEVLDILGRDAPLDWGWMLELDPDEPKEGPRLIWLVNRS
ncbi:MAG: hypothetical protein AAB074_04965 [Planctomycetota bacterium]